MNNHFKIFFIFLVISLTPIRYTYSQTNSTQNDFLLQNFILSLDGGISYGFSDYKNSSISPSVRGSFEYYPVIIQNARFGIKIFAGGLKLKFDDERNSISSNDGTREIPNEIITDAIQAGAGFCIGYVLGNNIIPSITVGGTFLEFSPKDSDGKVRPLNKQNFYEKNIFFLILEGELKVKVSEQLSLNAVLSYYPTSTDYLEDVSVSSSNDTYLTGMVGLSYAFKSNSDSDNDGIPDSYDQCPNTPKDVIVDEFGCPLDTDNDGVADYLDKCSLTPINVKVDSMGCPMDTDKDGIRDYLDKCPDTPPGYEVDEFGCPFDSDNDGVPDLVDRCFNTPIGISVDSVGCPIDTDKDGVPDYLDKCPGTPLNAKVDSLGCPDETVETFYQFNLRGEDTFSNSSANLKESAKLILNEIAFYLQNQLNSKWRIEGHMDSQGSVYTIKKLSYDRAKAVFDYLVSQGVNANQLEVYGLGDSFPIGNNNTVEGRNANRRIMIIRED